MLILRGVFLREVVKPPVRHGLMGVLKPW